MFQIYKKFFVVFSVLFMSVSTCFAQEFGSKSIARKVTSQNQAVFQQAVQDAFRQYLVYMSGHGKTPDLPQVKELLVKPEKYLLEFRYEPLAEDEIEIVSEYEQSKQAKWLLKLSFDYKAVESALFNVGAPIWQSPRPDLLVWLAYESEDGLRQVVSSNEENELKSSLRSVAAARGLILKLPIYDMEDRSVLSESALWGLFEEDIKAASKSYNESNSVAMRVFPLSADEWQYESRLIMHDNVMALNGTALSKELATKKALLQAMNIMADQYALQVDPNERQNVVIDISDIQKYNQLHALMSDLSRILMIKNVVPVSLKGNDIRLNLTIVGSRDLLKLTLLNLKMLEQKIHIDNEAIETQGAYETTLDGSNEVVDPKSSDPKGSDHVFQNGIDQPKAIDLDVNDPPSSDLSGTTETNVALTDVTTELSAEDVLFYRYLSEDPQSKAESQVEEQIDEILFELN